MWSKSFYIVLVIVVHFARFSKADFDDLDDIFDLDSEPDSFSSPSESPQSFEDDDPIRIVPMQSRSFLRGYYLEYVLVLIVLLYVARYLQARQNSSELGLAWYEHDRQNLLDNFALIGDSINQNASSSDHDERDNQALVKESDMYYRLWCSGRSGCVGVLVELSLSPTRFCLIHAVLARLKPKMAVKRLDDVLSFSVDLGPFNQPQQQYESSFVFCVVKKRLAAWHYKKCGDLQNFCSSTPQSLDSSFSDLKTDLVYFSEVSDLIQILTAARSTFSPVLNSGSVRYIHITDQFDMNVKRSENQASFLADQSTTHGFASNDTQRHRVMVVEFSFRALCESESTDISPVLFVANLIDKVAGYRVTNRQSIGQLEKKRVQAVEARLRQEHQKRQEEAQSRKEEKKRAEKQRAMNESDPEKQKKLMDRIHKQEVKKKQQKVKGKQMIVRM